ncbi:olfactory receptor 10AG1-like [Vombatus ursinus]|uniref:olfactory receptor 10AG1-like n=1 Tax=Vombatus ursinus TaxID=29139 RepID=UPI000FFDBB6B|nr:olfactory receptor 10AG1-like [Vombatus ursinus]
MYPELLPCVQEEVKEILLQKGVKLLSEQVSNLEELPLNEHHGSIQGKTDKETQPVANLVTVCNEIKINSSAYSSALGDQMAGNDALMINNHLQVEGVSNIYAIGNCATVKESKMVHHAGLHANFVVTTIVNTLKQRMGKVNTQKEYLLLAVMAHDHYVDICKLLYYQVIMNHKVYIQLVIGYWVTGMSVVIGQTYQIFSLPLSGSNKLNHVFCDMLPVVKLTCGNTFANQISVYADAVLFALIPSLLILGSYVKIILTILKLSSVTRRHKLFSTCSSHLIVFILFFGPGVIVYFRPKCNHSEGLDKVLSLFYTTVTPMFNPVIYTLRNKDAIGALRKLTLK